MASLVSVPFSRLTAVTVDLSDCQTEPRSQCWTVISALSNRRRPSSSQRPARCRQRHHMAGYGPVPVHHLAVAVKALVRIA